MPSQILFSICIPAYNRSNLLLELLNSARIAIEESNSPCEIVISEDQSAEQENIRNITGTFATQHSIPVVYRENTQNLGYDGNLRSLVALSSGQFCVFYGNDDLIPPKAIQHLENIVATTENLGVVIRSYASFRNSPESPVEVFRYSESEMTLKPSEQTAAFTFRRSVVISGLCIDRELSETLTTEELDGTLLYQLYLATRIALVKAVVVTPQILAFYRLDGIPEFGNSAAEVAVHTPGSQTVSSSVGFLAGMMTVLSLAAKSNHVSNERTFKLAVRKDIANYSYPFLAMHRSKGLRVFLHYVYDLYKVGVLQTPLALGYVGGLALLGRKPLDLLVGYLKRKRGSTPLLGSAQRALPK
jgi:abequosyltransferase